MIRVGHSYKIISNGLHAVENVAAASPRSRSWGRGIYVVSVPAKTPSQRSSASAAAGEFMGKYKGIVRSVLGNLVC